ncbi:MAG: hypothetical protein ACI9XO_001480 [Paraglaciecola sp.]|jgi:predicted GNAT family N-acyltransferase
MQISFTTANSDLDLDQILILQKENRPKNLSPQEIKAQGFVTVEHDFRLLKRMNSPHPHIIAKADNQVVAYALVMLSELRDDIPVLVPMFEKIDKLMVEGQPMSDFSYVVMGQVCVAKTCRGQGVFGGLYQKMAEEMKGDFDYIITEIATRNTRSIRAHEREGFTTLLEFDDGVEDWAIVGLKIP